VQNATIGEQAHDIEKLRAQVYDLGEKPVVAEPSPVPTPVPNAAPLKGDKGDDGRDATDQQVFSAVTQYCAVVAFCVGPKGDPGAPGKDGAAGTNGVDGSNGTSGADGAAGPPGADGPPGATGADGQPPLSWTYTDALGISNTCNRTDPFDASAPTYTCAPTSAAPTEGDSQ
jgi:hypothetical protein